MTRQATDIHTSPHPPPAATAPPPPAVTEGVPAAPAVPGAVMRVLAHRLEQTTAQLREAQAGAG